MKETFMRLTWILVGLLLCAPAAPGKARGGDTLFSEDFGGSLDQWGSAVGTWEIEGGKLKGVGAGGLENGSIYAGDPAWRSYVLSARIHFGNGNATLALRSTGHLWNEYRVLLWSKDSPKYASRYHVQRYRDGEMTSLTLDAPGALHGNAPSSVPITDPAEVLIEMIGGRFTLYVNGEVVGTVTDPQPLEAGRIGVGVVWDWECAFDSVAVSSRINPADVARERGEERERLVARFEEKRRERVVVREDEYIADLRRLQKDFGKRDRWKASVAIKAERERVEMGKKTTEKHKSGWPARLKMQRERFDKDVQRINEEVDEELKQALVAEGFDTPGR